MSSCKIYQATLHTLTIITKRHGNIGLFNDFFELLFLRAKISVWQNVIYFGFPVIHTGSKLYMQLQKYTLGWKLKNVFTCQSQGIIAFCFIVIDYSW